MPSYATRAADRGRQSGHPDVRNRKPQDSGLQDRLGVGPRVFLTRRPARLYARNERNDRSRTRRDARHRARPWGNDLAPRSRRSVAMHRRHLERPAGTWCRFSSDKVTAVFRRRGPSARRAARTGSADCPDRSLTSADARSRVIRYPALAANVRSPVAAFAALTVAVVVLGLALQIGNGFYEARALAALVLALLLAAAGVFGDPGGLASPSSPPGSSGRCSRPGSSFSSSRCSRPSRACTFATTRASDCSGPEWRWRRC